jgi:hypothetical protein
MEQGEPGKAEDVVDLLDKWIRSRCQFYFLNFPPQCLQFLGGFISPFKLQFAIIQQLMLVVSFSLAL